MVSVPFCELFPSSVSVGRGGVDPYIHRYVGGALVYY